MTARRLPTDPPVAETSNVVELRPGFSLPAAPAAADADPKVSPRPRRKVTRGPNLITKVTTETGRNHSNSSDLLRGTGLTQVNAQESLSPSQAVPSPSDPTFQRLVAKLPAMKLREAFPLEAISHNNMMGRARQGGYMVDVAFQDFRSFLAHVGPRPSEAWTLDREDPRNPVYGPGLVRWRDKRQQANNRADTVFLTMDGITRPLAEWARLTGQERRTLAKRVQRGWSHAEAIKGRRLEDEEPSPAGHAPSASAPSAPARPDSMESWPEGVSAGMWEEAFRGFCKHLPNGKASGLTRTVFFAWIGTNAVRHAGAALSAAFPNYFEGIDPEPDGYGDHQASKMIEAYGKRTEAARRSLNELQRSMMESLLRQYPAVTHPRQAPSLIEPDEDD